MNRTRDARASVRETFSSAVRFGSGARSIVCALEISPERANVKTSAARSAALNSCTGRRSTSAGVHLADLSSDLKSATGPRWVSLSGLTIELILVI